MKRSILALALCGISTVALAELPTLAEIKAQNGAQLSAEELKQLLPAAKVESRGKTGLMRRWTNDTSGKFVSTGESENNMNRFAPTGHGEWTTRDNGTYCVKIDWTAGQGGAKRWSEDWCNYIFKAGDKFFGFPNLGEATVAGQESKFSK